jgi:sigma-B regulation protein RsbU (phosphoserine phosphatase)
MSASKTQNLYQSSDPELLLRLKRMESERMLDIVRSDQPDVNPAELIDRVVSIIRGQLGVRCIAFIRVVDDQMIIESNHGFGPLAVSSYERLIKCRLTTKVTHSLYKSLFDKGVEYIVPLSRNGYDPKAWFLIAQFADSEEEKRNDLLFIETAGNILLTGLENKRLFARQLAQRALQRELELAAQIQQQSLPGSFDLHPQLDIYGQSLAHHSIGGDFYDLFPISEHELYLCVGDAAGKGVAAALLISNIHATLRMMFEMRLDLDAICRQLNTMIYRLTAPDGYATLFVGLLDMQTRTLRYVNAGQNPPLHAQGTQVTELRTGCIPLGCFPFLEAVEIGEVTLIPGDVLMVYTDGVVEQENLAGDILGIEPVADLLRNHCILPVRELAAEIQSAVDDFAGEAPKSDDMTMLVLKVRNGD